MHQSRRSTNAKEIQLSLIPNKNFKTDIPSWVDQNYTYDPQNPRKPKHARTYGGIIWKKCRRAYIKNQKKMAEISNQASEILYGVIGSQIKIRETGSYNEFK